MFFCYNKLGDLMKLIIGSHVSFKKDTQLLGSVEEALSYKANTFMFYTGAPQNTKRVDLDLNLMEEAKKLMLDNGIDINNVVVHAPYIINPANIKNRDFNIEFLKQEISRTHTLGVKYLILHPGSHVGLGIDAGIKNIIDCLKEALKDNEDVDICLETMAGKGTELGRNFEQLKKIIDGVASNHIKVCLDTCHINDAGYDLSDFDKILDEFNEIIGLDNLAVVHINDSKNVINSHKDRHDNIGYGRIGFDNLINVIYNDRIKDVPKILETPYVGIDSKYPPYLFEIDMIRNKKFNDKLIKEVEAYYNKC